MFDKIAAQLEKLSKEGLPLKHEFDKESAAWIAASIFVAVFFAMMLALLIYSQIPKK